MTFFNIPLLLFSFLPEQILLTVSGKFSIFMYWVENIFYVLGFAGIEIIFVPFVYLKMFVIIPWSVPGNRTKILYTIIWLFAGTLITIFIALRDVWNFLFVLSKHNGFREAL